MTENRKIKPETWLEQGNKQLINNFRGLREAVGQSTHATK